MIIQLNYNFFLFMVVLWIVLMLYIAFRIVTKGKTLPLIMRKAEIEEHVAKMQVLEKHGQKPNERNRKRKWFGLFSWIDDDVEYNEDDDIDVTK